MTEQNSFSKECKNKYSPFKNIVTSIAIPKKNAYVCTEL